MESVATNSDHPSSSAGLALHAIGADDPDERASIEDHLVTCARCREELVRLRDAASALAPIDRRDLDRCWDRIASRLHPQTG